MKRSGPIKRRTALKPGKPPARKTRLRRIGLKRRKQMNATSQPRKTFKAEFRMCMLCTKRIATDVHEIVTRAKSSKSVEHRCAWLCLCRTCHREEVGDYSRYPISRQLALKLVTDPEAFDLDKINELRGNDPNEFTMADVARHLRMA